MPAFYNLVNSLVLLHFSLFSDAGLIESVDDLTTCQAFKVLFYSRVNGDK
jgi:hypothetical protein